MFGTSESYVRAVRQRTGADGFPRRTAADLDWQFNRHEIAMLIRAAKTDRDRLMLDLAYFGGLRASELVSLTWAQVIRCDRGEAQLSIVGKGSKGWEVLIPTGDRRPAHLPVAAMRRDGSPHSIRVYQRVGERFLGALATAGKLRATNARAGCA